MNTMYFCPSVKTEAPIPMSERNVSLTTISPPRVAAARGGVRRRLDSPQCFRAGFFKELPLKTRGTLGPGFSPEHQDIRAMQQRLGRFGMIERGGGVVKSDLDGEVLRSDQVLQFQRHAQACPQRVVAVRVNAGSEI